MATHIGWSGEGVGVVVVAVSTSRRGGGGGGVESSLASSSSTPSLSLVPPATGVSITTAGWEVLGLCRGELEMIRCDVMTGLCWRRLLFPVVHSVLFLLAGVMFLEGVVLLTVGGYLLRNASCAAGIQAAQRRQRMWGMVDSLVFQTQS